MENKKEENIRKKEENLKDTIINNTNIPNPEIVTTKDDLFLHSCSEIENFFANITENNTKRRHIGCEYNVNSDTKISVCTIGTRKFSLKTSQYNLKKTDSIYFCNDCLFSYSENISYERHKLKCDKEVPGRFLIYKENNLHIYKIFGYSNISYCQNLCILGKCFISHKTLFWDIDNYNFYVLYDEDNFIGFFSEEVLNKENNLSCIVILPDCQKKGYGTLLVDLSFFLKKGTCERPLSSEGEVLYNKYWKAKVYNFLERNNGKEYSINDISQKLNMTPDDVSNTLKLLNCNTDDSFISLKSWKASKIRLIKKEYILQ